MRFLLFALLISAGITTGCSDQPSAKSSPAPSPSDSLFRQVMEGHDAGMAKIGRLKKYSTRLGVITDSLNQLNPANKKLIKQLNSVRDSLNASNEAMFTWMESFKADTLQDIEKKRQQYLQLQHREVIQVRDRIIRSIALYDSLSLK